MFVASFDLWLGIFNLYSVINHDCDAHLGEMSCWGFV